MWGETTATNWTLFQIGTVSMLSCTFKKCIPPIFLPSTFSYGQSLFQFHVKKPRPKLEQFVLCTTIAQQAYWEVADKSGQRPSLLLGFEHETAQKTVTCVCSSYLFETSEAANCKMIRRSPHFVASHQRYNGMSTNAKLLVREVERTANFEFIRARWAWCGHTP